MPKNKTYTRQETTNLDRERKERKAKIIGELEAIGVSAQIIQEIGPVNQLAAFAQGIRWAMENFFEEQEPEQSSAIVLASEHPPSLIPVYTTPEDAEALYLFREFMRNSRNAQIICELMHEELEYAQP